MEKIGEKQNSKVQYLVVRLADGRKGIFIGPELISSGELKLNPPQIAEIVFTEPKERNVEVILPESGVKNNEKKETMESEQKDNSVSTPSLVVQPTEGGSSKSS